MNREFWRHKKLDEMTQPEWDALCDGCAKCCLHKLEDEDTGEILFTRVACKLLDLHECRCTHYEDRTRLITGCLDLRHAEYKLAWLPSTCAYRLLAEGKELPVWHPLRSGDPNSVHHAAVSVRRFAIIETADIDPVDHVIEEFD